MNQSTGDVVSEHPACSPALVRLVQPKSVAPLAGETLDESTRLLRQVAGILLFLGVDAPLFFAGSGEAAPEAGNLLSGQPVVLVQALQADPSTDDLHRKFVLLEVVQGHDAVHNKVRLRGH